MYFSDGHFSLQGMGEPMQNIENVLRATEIMIDLHGLHFSPRKVTVSTSGLVPQIRRFCRESPCALAVSLNATTDEVNIGIHHLKWSDPCYCATFILPDLETIL